MRAIATKEMMAMEHHDINMGNGMESEKNINNIRNKTPDFRDLAEILQKPKVIT